MRFRNVDALASGDVSSLGQRQRGLVAFADKLTRSPQSFGASDTEALVDALGGDEGDALEAATVVAGFNFANRVADALAVPRELPDAFDRWPLLRGLAMRLMSLGIRWRMRMSRNVPNPPADMLLQQLRSDAERLRMGTVPPYFERMRIRPHVLAGQTAICRAVLLDSRLSRQAVLRIGYLISALNSDLERVDDIARVLEADGLHPPRPPYGEGDMPTLDREMLQFANDVTVDATGITDEQVRSLRRQIGDVGVLDLVLLSAAYNGGNRLSRVFGESSEAASPRWYHAPS